MPKTGLTPGKPTVIKIGKAQGGYTAIRSKEGSKGKGEKWIATNYVTGSNRGVVYPDRRYKTHQSAIHKDLTYKTGSGKLKQGFTTKILGTGTAFAKRPQWGTNRQREIKRQQRRVPHEPKASGHFEPWEKKRLTMDTPVSSNPKRRKTKK